MADVTINALIAATPSTNAVIPFSESNSTNRVNVNSIVGLTTNGAHRGTLQRGSYGSLTIGGSNNGWSGIDFTDATATLMVRNSDAYSGVYKTDNTWIWAFDQSGSLVTGTVPWSSVSGKPSNSQLAKAWVSFDATRQANGNPVTGNQYLYIRSSYNVSGVLRVGGGQYQIYFTNSISGDYCVTGTSEHYRGSNAALVYIDRVPSNGSGPIQTTYCTINTLSYTGAAYDSAAYVSVVIYGA
jgi:hypothetical protein